MKSSDAYNHGSGSQRNKPVSNPNTQSWLRTISRGRQNSYERVKAAVKSNPPQNNKENAAFNSTSEYLRNLVLSSNSAGVPRRATSATNIRVSSSYTRQPEDMQEEIMQLKKNVLALTHENSILKTQLKKYENELSKKHKDIEELLDPNQRMINVNDKNSNLTINSMKQKLLRLEQTVKDKETSLQKMKSDLKMTRTEEMRTQMEAMYQEILRLQHLHSDPDAASLPRELQTKLKSMNETILRLNDNNAKLQHENKKLRSKTTDETDDDEKMPVKDDYGKMDKAELIKLVVNLEKKLTSNSTNDRKKSTLIVSEEKVQDLLDERDKLKEAVKKLKDDKQKSKVLLDEKQKEISKLRREIEKLEEKTGQKSTALLHRNSKIDSGHLVIRDSDNSSVEDSPKLIRKDSLKKHFDESPISSPEITRNTKSKHAISETKRKSFTSSSKIKNKERLAPQPKRRMSVDIEAKVEKFRRNKAAKTIQRNWRKYQTDKTDDVFNDKRSKDNRKKFAEHESDSDDDLGHVDHKDSSDIDEAISVIGAAARAHMSRTHAKSKMRDDPQSMRSASSSKSNNATRNRKEKSPDMSDDDFFNK